MKNNAWSMDELKITLELYLRLGRDKVSKISNNFPDLFIISEILRTLDIVPSDINQKYRSVNSVRLKLLNFHAIDKCYCEKTMAHVGNGDRIIWNRYRNDTTTLKREVLEYLRKHLLNKKNLEVESYINRIQNEIDIGNDEVCGGNEDYAIYAVSSASEYLKNLIIKMPSTEYKDKLLNCCNEIFCVLKEYSNSINTQCLVSTERTKDSNKVHEGINQIPVDDTQTKIGQHVKNTIDKFIKYHLITDEMIDLMTNLEWSRKTFGIGYPVLREVKDNIDIQEQKKGIGGHIRYYKTIYKILGSKYFLCKEWFKEYRDKFDIWADSILENLRIDLDVSQLQELLHSIKDIDSQGICIEVGNIPFLQSIDVKKILDDMVRIGLLSYFEGERNRYVVDDYDLLYEMSSNIEKFSRKKP